ncbi:hypothetical protein [Streptomyces sp. NPDC005907]|uniref:hypothetical protein n=1 Tax=Streptomyces sp. NPDC005907 TaxID=3154571 RepID=UPI0033EA5970
MGLLLASCSTGGGGEGAGASVPSSAPRVSRTAAGASETELGDRARDALAAVASGTFVESGSERVADGIHTEPGLKDGKTYRLSLVCLGTGGSRLTFTPESGPSGGTVPCDQSVVQRRFKGRAPLRIDTEGAVGAAGVIAWRIDAL